MYEIPYVTINGVSVWQNWTNSLVTVTNSTNPIGALTGSIGKALPWFWPMIPFALYLVMFIEYQEAPGRWKLAAITGLVLIISIYMGAAGLINNVFINLAIFMLAYFVSFLFKG